MAGIIKTIMNKLAQSEYPLPEWAFGSPNLSIKTGVEAKHVAPQPATTTPPAVPAAPAFNPEAFYGNLQGAQAGFRQWGAGNASGMSPMQARAAYHKVADEQFKTLAEAYTKLPDGSDKAARKKQLDAYANNLANLGAVVKQDADRQAQQANMDDMLSRQPTQREIESLQPADRSRYYQMRNQRAAQGSAVDRSQQARTQRPQGMTATGGFMPLGGGYSLDSAGNRIVNARTGETYADLSDPDVARQMHTAFASSRNSNAAGRQTMDSYMQEAAKKREFEQKRQMWLNAQQRDGTIPEAMRTQYGLGKTKQDIDMETRIKDDLNKRMGAKTVKTIPTATTAVQPPSSVDTGIPKRDSIRNAYRQEESEGFGNVTASLHKESQLLSASYVPSNTSVQSMPVGRPAGAEVPDMPILSRKASAQQPEANQWQVMMAQLLSGVMPWLQNEYSKYQKGQESTNKKAWATMPAVARKSLEHDYSTAVPPALASAAKPAVEAPKSVFNQLPKKAAFDDPAELLAQKIATIRGFSVAGADSAQGDSPKGQPSPAPDAATVDDEPPTSGGRRKKAVPLAGDKPPATQYPHEGADDGAISVPDITLEPIKVASIMDANEYLRGYLQKMAEGQSAPADTKNIVVGQTPGSGGQQLPRIEPHVAGKSTPLASPSLVQPTKTQASAALTPQHNGITSARQGT